MPSRESTTSPRRYIFPFNIARAFVPWNTPFTFRLTTNDLKPALGSGRGDTSADGGGAGTSVAADCVVVVAVVPGATAPLFADETEGGAGGDAGSRTAGSAGAASVGKAAAASWAATASRALAIIWPGNDCG